MSYITFISLCLFLLGSLFSQSISVSGTISTQTRVVQFCKITFLNSFDTTKTYSTSTNAAGYFSINLPTSINKENQIAVPNTVHLEQNYPNPFSSLTTLQYTLPKQMFVKVTVYNILGQEIKTLRDNYEKNGMNAVVWDGTNMFGIKVTPGVYFYKIETEHFHDVKKMIYTGGGDLQIPFNATNLYSFSKFNRSIHSAEMYYVLIESADTTNPYTVPTRIENYTLLPGINNFAVDSARIIIGKSLDGVEIGDDSATVKRKLGNTYESEIDYGYIFYYLEGIHKTMLVYVLIGGAGAPTSWKGVVELNVQQPYMGESKEGIKLGVQRDFVWKKLGKPVFSDTLTAFFGDYYIYEKKDSTNIELLVGYEFLFNKNSNILTNIRFLHF